MGDDDGGFEGRDLLIGRPEGPTADSATASPAAEAATPAPAASADKAIQDILACVRGIAASIEPPAGRGPAGQEVSERMETLDQNTVKLGRMVMDLRAQTTDAVASLDEAMAAFGRRIEALKELTAEHEDRLRVHIVDMSRAIEMLPRLRVWLFRLAVLCAAVGAPALIALGIFLEDRYEIVVREDPTGGWKDHVWNRYGRTIADCAVVARTEDRLVECPVTVRAP